DEIAEISLHVGDYHDLMFQPLDERRAPSTLADAKFSNFIRLYVVVGHDVDGGLHVAVRSDDTWPTLVQRPTPEEFPPEV
ncbi:MmgE/PrpD family protein, partial [Rhizobium ruizarguesonis]